MTRPSTRWDAVTTSPALSLPVPLPLSPFSLYQIFSTLNAQADSEIYPSFEIIDVKARLMWWDSVILWSTLSFLPLSCILLRFHLFLFPLVSLPFLLSFSFLFSISLLSFPSFAISLLSLFISLSLPFSLEFLPVPRWKEILECKKVTISFMMSRIP